MSGGPLEELARLHDQVDRRARALAARHGERITCARGCKDCCVDGITVFEVEAARIRDHHPELLENGAPHPEGACAFLDQHGACRIYAHRPFVCRTQGLPLVWFEEDDGGEIHEHRDICPLNAEGPPLTDLDHDACWPLGEVELKLQGLQDQFGGSQRRVSLRSLFR